MLACLPVLQGTSCAWTKAYCICVHVGLCCAVACQLNPAVWTMYLSTSRNRLYLAACLVPAEVAPLQGCLCYVVR